MSSQPISGFGYFGKVPARGDFIQGHLPNDFVSAWRECLVVSGDGGQLGAALLQSVTSFWSNDLARFACPVSL
ncbi:TagF domain-containing protein [Agarivorans sp. QJM3NY_33]|uniref:TagF domain-containing protein n=1 Tax=Agarivorans sp. QJM3NY_33 TaxID=3421432 RepID=UPI003D7E42CA